MGAGPLLCPVPKGNVHFQDRLADVTVYDIVVGLVEEAELKHATPHDFRRTVLSTMLERGIDLLTVSNVAGHATPVTTQRYDMRGEAAKRIAAHVVEVPGL